MPNKPKPSPKPTPKPTPKPPVKQGPKDGPKLKVAPLPSLKDKLKNLKKAPPVMKKGDNKKIGRGY